MENTSPEINLQDNQDNKEETEQIEPKMKKRFALKINKKVLIIFSVLIVIAALIATFFVIRSHSKKSTQNYSVQTAQKGDITVSISATGVIEPVSEHEIVPQVQGEILSAPYEIGQTVQKDDVLFTIDSKDVANSIEKSQNALDRSKSTYNQSLEALDDLTVYAPFTGVVTNTYVNNGDNIQSGAKIADIINQDEMVLTVPFLAEQADSLSAGQSADVTVSGTYYKLSGVVSEIPSGSILNAQNVPVKNIKIKVTNPGGIAKGQSATAIVGSIACNTSGTFDYSDSTTVVSKSSGTVSLNFHNGDKVQKGSLMVSLDNRSSRNTVDQNASSVKDAELALDSSNKQLDNYIIKSPIAGTIISKDAKAGDVISASTSKTVLATVADLSQLTFDVTIDELDIKKVQVGQSVEVTADALPDAKFAAHVDTISINGTSTNGVTTYPVTIKMDDMDGLMPGMNVNAKIMIQQKTDVITVPVSAVMRGNMIAVKDDGTSSKNNSNNTFNSNNGNRDSSNNTNGNPNGKTNQATPRALLSNGDPVPPGYVLKQVEVGLNDENNIEIVNGLNEGDSYIIPIAKTITSTTQANPMMIGGQMGGAMGGNFNQRRPTTNSSNRSSSGTTGSSSSGSSGGNTSSSSGGR